MLSSQTVVPDLFKPQRLPDAKWRSLVEPWTAECPDPEHWLKTTGFDYARGKVEEALRSGPGPILMSGPTGYGKTLLLRSLRTLAPSGYVPLLIPFSNVEPREIARWILACTLKTVVGDPAVEFASLLKVNVRSGGNTLLLMDEVQSTPRATLAKLFELLAESGVAVRVVLAGLPGDDLDQVIAEVPLSIQRIEIAEPWSRVDAELLLTHVALTLGIPATELIATIDVDGAISASAGNPRLVRAALGQQLRFAEPARVRIAPVPAALPLPISAPRAPFSTSPDPSVPISSVDCATSHRAFGTVKLDRVRQSAQVVLERAEGIIRSNGYRVGSAARDRVLEGCEQLQSRLLLYGTAVRNKGDVWIRQVKRAISNAGLLAALVGRTDRARAWIANSWQSTTQAFFANMNRIRCRMVLAVIEIRIPLIRLRSRTNAYYAALSGRVSGRVGDLKAAVVAMRLALLRCTQEVLRGAQHLLRGRYGISRFPVRNELAIAGALVALGASVVIGRMPIRSIISLLGDRGEVNVEPIPFRLNSHPWAVIAVDGVEAGSTPLTISLEPGSHHFRVVMADGRIHEEMLVVSTVQDHHAFR